MAKPTRTKFERENDLERISALYLRGWRQVDIANELNLSRQQIGYDLKTIQERWRESTALNLDEAKQKELARLDELERECWQAWASSKGERTKARQEKNVTGTTVKASMEKEQRDGNPAFLQGVLSCIDRRCKLLGIDAPVRTHSEVKSETTVKRDLTRLSVDELRNLKNMVSKLEDADTDAR